MTVGSTGTDIQRLVVRSVCRDGEVLVRMVRGSEFQIAIYDADFLDYALNREATKDSNAIVQGIELDRAGKPVAYYLWKMPPNKVPSIFGMPTKSPNINQYERVSPKTSSTFTSRIAQIKFAAPPGLRR